MSNASITGSSSVILVTSVSYGAPVINCTPGHITDEGWLGLNPKMVGATEFAPKDECVRKIFGRMLEEWRVGGII